MNSPDKKLWQEYLQSLPENHAHKKLTQPSSFSFGDNPRLSDELLNLVLAGTKTATCGALWWYEADNVPVPKVGELFIVQNGLGVACCITMTTEVIFKSFKEMDAAFAFSEGEGDRSLQAWQEGHERYFRRTLPSIGREFEETMPLVCERFKVIYSAF